MLKINQKYTINSDPFTVIDIKMSSWGRELYIVDIKDRTVFWDKELMDDMIRRGLWKCIKIIDMQILPDDLFELE